MSDLKSRYQAVLENIALTARSAGRDENDIRLVVVTKGHPIEQIEELHRLGARLIGENRIAEARDKQAALDTLPGIEWHMIGHLQSRKAADAAGRFALIHSVDSVKLARRLDRFAGQAGANQPVLLQFNVSGEESKFGFEASDEGGWESLLPVMEEILAFEHLQVRGLMTMAPFNPDPEAARPSFARLRRLRDALARQFPAGEWDDLSMGMSGDFQTAIQEGATLLRIGTAITG